MVGKVGAHCFLMSYKEDFSRIIYSITIIDLFSKRKNLFSVKKNKKGFCYGIKFKA